MNKTELTSVVAAATGYQKKDVETVVESVFANITAALSKGEKVSLKGFGNFEVRERSARKGVNPKLLKELKDQGIDVEEAKTQATIQIEESKAPAFKPAKALKDTVNQ